MDRFINKMVNIKLVAPADEKIFKITSDLKEIVKSANKIGHSKISENYYDGFREASKINS